MKFKVKNYFNGSVKLISSRKLSDNRGFFSEIFNIKDLDKLGIKNKFIQENYVFSKNEQTIRGLHFQKPPKDQAKLITVLQGKILDIVLDLRKNSKTFGKYKKIILSGEEKHLFIPSGFAHGYKTLCKDIKIIYKVDNYYSPEDEITLLWSDKKININWELKNNKKLYISKKDKKGYSFNDLKYYFK